MQFNYVVLIILPFKEISLWPEVSSLPRFRILVGGYPECDIHRSSGIVLFFSNIGFSQSVSTLSLDYNKYSQLYTALKKVTYSRKVYCLGKIINISETMNYRITSIQTKVSSLP